MVSCISESHNLYLRCVVKSLLSHVVCAWAELLFLAGATIMCVTVRK